MKSEKTSKNQKSEELKKVPVVNVRMMSDEEWNTLAYRNYLQRKQGI